MGWFGDVFDNVLGQNPGPSSYELANAALIQQIQQQAAANQAATAPPAAAAPPATAPPAAAAPPPVVQSAAPVFDASPYRSQVDTGFSMFTPEFYANKYAAAYDPYKTGVESQFGLAKDALTSGVAKRGLADSQQGRGLFQQLDALRDQALNTGQSTAQGFQTSLSDQVNAAKQNLYSSIGAGNDNASVGSRAQTEAQRIAGTAPPANSLGDIFGGLVGPYASSKSPGGPVNPELQAFSTGGNLNLANTGGGGPAASTSVVGTKKKKF